MFLFFCFFFTNGPTVRCPGVKGAFSTSEKVIDEQIDARPCRPTRALPPWSFPAVRKSGTDGGGNVSIFGPPPLPVTMTTAVDGGERRRGAGWLAELRQVLLRFAHRPWERWAGWELRGHLRTRTVVSAPAPRSLAFSRTHFDWRLTERRNGAPLGLHPVLQAAERLVLVLRGSASCAATFGSKWTSLRCDAVVAVMEMLGRSLLLSRASRCALVGVPHALSVTAVQAVSRTWSFTEYLALFN